MKNNTQITDPLSPETKEQLVYEVLSFMQKWGLWRDSSIIANNTAWIHTYDNSVKYRDLPGVEIVTPVFAEEGTEESAEYGIVTEWNLYANPEQIFDMTFEGPLYELLNCGEYSVSACDITDGSAWDEIAANTNIIETQLMEYIGVYDAWDLQEQLLFNPDELKEMGYIVWDSSDFDSWEDFQYFSGETEEGIYLEPNLAEVSDEWQEFIHQVTDLESVNRAWDTFIEQAKVLYREEMYDTISDRGKLANLVSKAFDKIFDKYGLYWVPGFSWSLTCYRG